MSELSWSNCSSDLCRSSCFLFLQAHKSSCRFHLMPKSFINPYAPWLHFHHVLKTLTCSSGLEHGTHNPIFDSSAVYLECMFTNCMHNQLILWFLNGWISLFQVDLFCWICCRYFNILWNRIFVVVSGRFPGEHGVVAPGLSCQYPVKFAPDSLADYDDVIKVTVHVN